MVHHFELAIPMGVLLPHHLFIYAHCTHPYPPSSTLMVHMPTSRSPLLKSSLRTRQSWFGVSILTREWHGWTHGCHKSDPDPDDGSGSTHGSEIMYPWVHLDRYSLYNIANLLQCYQPLTYIFQPCYYAHVSLSSWPRHVCPVMLLHLHHGGADMLSLLWLLVLIFVILVWAHCWVAIIIIINSPWHLPLVSHCCHLHHAGMHLSLSLSLSCLGICHGRLVVIVIVSTHGKAVMVVLPSVVIIIVLSPSSSCSPPPPCPCSCPPCHHHIMPTSTSTSSLSMVVSPWHWPWAACHQQGGGGGASCHPHCLVPFLPSLSLSSLSLSPSSLSLSMVVSLWHWPWVLHHQQHRVVVVVSPSSSLSPSPSTSSSCQCRMVVVVLPLSSLVLPVPITLHLIIITLVVIVIVMSTQGRVVVVVSSSFHHACCSEWWWWSRWEGVVVVVGRWEVMVGCMVEGGEVGGNSGVHG